VDLQSKDNSVHGMKIGCISPSSLGLLLVRNCMHGSAKANPLGLLVTFSAIRQNLETKFYLHIQRSYLHRFAKFLLAALTYQTSASSWRSATTVFSIESATTHNMSGTAFCRTVQPYASQNYDLRPRQHDRQLPTNASHIMHCNFTTRILYKDAY